MRSKFMCFFLALCVLVTSSFVAPSRSEAAVGFLVKKTVVKVIGGIGTGAGAVLATTGLVVAGTSNATGWAALGTAIAAAAYIGYGILFGAVGLIILDDKQTVADVEFVKLSPDRAPNLDLESIEIYNSEVEELNAIRKTIQAELKEEDTVEKARDLWLSYSVYLSPETKAIAEAQAAAFIKAK